MTTPDTTPAPKESSTSRKWDRRKVGIYVLQCLAIWAVLVVGYLVYDQFNRPEKTLWASFVSIAGPGLLVSPVFRWKIERVVRM